MSVKKPIGKIGKYTEDVAKAVINQVEKRRKFLGALLTTAILVFALEFSSVWWLALFGGFLGGLILSHNSTISAFISGFLGGALGWGLNMAIIAFFNPLDRLNIITSRFGWNAGSVVMITLVLGGLLASFGALNGKFLAEIISHHRQKPQKNLELKKIE